MTSASAFVPPGSGGSDHLRGVHILLVEDSWPIGQAMKNLLEVLGADVAGPAATSAEAERLIAKHMPDVAIVDFHLRGGERASGLIDLLHDRGVPTIVITGYGVLPLPPGKVVAILQKPISKALLLSTLGPILAQRTTG